MSHSMVRVLTLLELLQTHQRLTGAEIAERLETDARTVRRDITILQEWGIPVIGERGRYGAYRLMPGFKLPPLMFTEDEVAALVVGLMATQQIGIAQAMPAVEGALAKIERVLPATLRGRMQALKGTLSFEAPMPSSAPLPGIVVTLGQAVAARYCVWMRYRSEGNKEETERQFAPYGIAYHAERWYTAGYCYLRQDIRLFRLDRIDAIKLLTEPFRRPDDFAVLDFVQETLARLPGTWWVRVLLKTTIDEARRAIPSGTALLQETANGVEMQIYVDQLEWMARFLVRLGVPFVVREPRELRDTLGKLAATIRAMAMSESEIPD
jgi:predicted DNA-binding transcriptional regulator YafY